MASPHGHQSPYAKPPAGDEPLVKMSCPARSPPLRSAMSRKTGWALWMLTDVHSLPIAAATAARAFASASTLNDDVTHVSRVSQLHPREGQARRRFLSALKTCDHESPAAPVDIGMSG